MIAALYKYRAPSLSISASVAYFSIEHSALNDVQACVEKAIKLMISPCQKNPGVFGTIVITHDWNYGPIGHCDKFKKNVNWNSTNTIFLRENTFRNWVFQGFSSKMISRNFFQTLQNRLYVKSAINLTENCFHEISVTTKQIIFTSHTVQFRKLLLVIYSRNSQCGKSTIFLPVRFCVKSFLVNRVSKMWQFRQF